MNVTNEWSVSTTHGRCLFLPRPPLVLIGKKEQQMDLRQSLEGTNIAPYLVVTSSDFI